MKRLFSSILVFLLIVLPVSAQETELKIATPTEIPVPAIEYTLPYPGILPDNPLYPLKAARDRVISFFIADSVKKADFDLLQADKRINAGIFLLQKKDPDTKRAISTISKGQNYFEQAVISFEKAKREKKPTEIGDLSDRLYNASRKHTEVLRKEETKISREYRDAYSSLRERSEKLSRHIADLKTEK